MRRAILLVCLLALSVPGGARANPVTQPECPGTTKVAVWKQLGNDLLENLLFADAALWVSDGTKGSVLRFDASGNEGAGLTAIPSPGGLAQGADGLIYAGWGNSLGNSISRNGAAKVVRFNPSNPNATMATYAQGFNMPNGMTFGIDGALYISNDFDIGLVRIPSGGGSWQLVNDTWGTNGLAIIGDTLYSAITFDQRSPIEATRLATGAHHTAVQLSFGAASLQPAIHTNGDPDRPLVGLKGLDDMTTDGKHLYPVANGMGELLRVDPSTGDACLIRAVCRTRRACASLPSRRRSPMGWRKRSTSTSPSSPGRSAGSRSRPKLAWSFQDHIAPFRV